ncbi:hypothetical protein COV24_00805 [candidate division WWE3 bacterium CG10_big_fil_rev_8_21_14_0_10_32_10]|uniref:Dockerin domain-containing protein n=1 Tax=candidate division WWE3 bacterium CG10_big_fil_rev_8_21_14_0_10_32_10 TaxID=1975090 RepID=A0A2H0RCI8_UNCKA|nr:MAG: hypothetical protein COV24_00805 [candidate division WWE3 bacterium CG10_big_fil_rev_8_21_14_0_10_32_10]
MLNKAKPQIFFIFLVSVLFFIVVFSYTKVTNAQQSGYDSSEWFMAGANPQRTSHVDSTPTNQTEIPGKLYPEWFIPLEPYIPYGWQLIFANDTIFVSTARGLYAIDINAGELYSQDPNNPDKPWIKWVFPTELPLGQSPTVVKNSQGEYIVYVGGFDKKVYALKADPTNTHRDTTTQQRINDDVVWTFDAQGYWNTTEPTVQHIAAGFNTNPLVIDTKVFLGNRDGYMYALDQSNGTLLWHFKTEGPITFSAAANLDNSIIYFASNDSYGYALNSDTGNLIWQSDSDPSTPEKDKFPGAGFLTWWPVYYHHPTKGDYVIFSGSHNYRSIDPDSPDPDGTGPEKSLFQGGLYTSTERNDLYPGYIDTRVAEFVAGRQTGDWALGTFTYDLSQPVVGSTATPVTEYFEDPTQSEEENDPAGFLRHDHKPWRRAYFVLNASSGTEKIFDFDQDGNNNYAPIVWTGTQSGTRYPPAVGPDNALYQQISYLSAVIPHGGISGWTFGTTFISKTMDNVAAVDEPHAYALGGKMLYYWNCCDREFATVDLTKSVDDTVKREWNHVSYNLDTVIPDYNQGGYGESDLGKNQNFETYGGYDGVYGKHGSNNPAIPYKGKLYTQKGNSIIAFSPTNGSIQHLSEAVTQTVTTSATLVSSVAIKKYLAEEIDKLLQSGHLFPGYQSAGIQDPVLDTIELASYWKHPFDLYITLSRAYDQLPAQQLALVNYIQNEYAEYPPYQSDDIGWITGTPRETFAYKPEFERNRATIHPQIEVYTDIWGTNGKNPQAVYALWKYAKLKNFDNNEASALYNLIVTSTNKNTGNNLMTTLNTAPDASLTDELPFILNAYIAGYVGYINLAHMADPTGANPTIQQDIQARETQLQSLLQTRIQQFSKYSPYRIDSDISNAVRSQNRRRVLNASRNFINMIPELADTFTTSTQVCADGAVITDCVHADVDFYNNITPFWFVSRYDISYNEASVQPVYDYHSLFQAKAQILKEPYENLVKYLDVPAVERGDLFYIDNLVSLLEAPTSNTPPTGDLNGDNNVNIQDIIILINEIFTPSGVQGSDINSDGKVDILDVISLINLIFS